MTDNTEKPHLVLEWHYDIPEDELKCTLADGELVYIAHEGGSKGYTKIYKGEETFIKSTDWDSSEKFWISEQYGELYGYFQPDPDRVGLEPRTGQMEGRSMGLGRHGEYLDHLQRSQRQLNNGDVTFIIADEGVQEKNNNSPAIPSFVTTDGGYTIYKLLPTNDTYYNGHYNKEHEDGVWSMVPQPCMMQPRSRSYVLSSYEEMEIVGFTQETIDRCKAGGIALPEFPELQDLYVYPEINMHPLTEDNYKDIY